MGSRVKSLTGGATEFHEWARRTRAGRGFAETALRSVGLVATPHYVPPRTRASVTQLGRATLEPILGAHGGLAKSTVVCDYLTAVGAPDMLAQSRGMLTRFLVGVAVADPDGPDYESCRCAIALLHHIQAREDGTAEPPQEDPPADPISVDGELIKPAASWCAPQVIPGLPGGEMPPTTYASAEWARGAGGNEEVTRLLVEQAKDAFIQTASDGPFRLAVESALARARAQSRSASEEPGEVVAVANVTCAAESYEGPALQWGEAARLIAGSGLSGRALAARVRIGCSKHGESSPYWPLRRGGPGREVLRGDKARTLKGAVLAVKERLEGGRKKRM